MNTALGEDQGRLHRGLWPQVPKMPGAHGPKTLLAAGALPEGEERPGPQGTAV